MISNYDKNPTVKVPNGHGRCAAGWPNVINRLDGEIRDRNAENGVLTIDCYVGVNEQEILDALEVLQPARIIRSSEAFLEPAEVDAKVAPFNGGNDPLFGWITSLQLSDFFDPERLQQLQERAAEQVGGLTVIIGAGASLVHTGDILVYADLARWESQLRMRRGEFNNLGIANRGLKWSLQYKRAYFTDWRVCDRHKRTLMHAWNLVLDTNRPNDPRLASGADVRRGLQVAVQQPFRVVPFFDPAPWGGQWMKEVCDLDRSVDNYGWCFDCVPEENSLLLSFGDVCMELPSVNVVYLEPQKLLGEKVHARFGDEFPIRFDFLDTMDGGHLSFQVHPLTEYIQQHFGMNYTQDESYYLLDAGNDACVYLGTRNDIDRKAMIDDLQSAQRGEKAFDDKKFINCIPAKKHDHFLIPAGTVHCSGKNSMVLEISATPYIFTFKMWDWGRLGLDGLPRPININLEHGVKNIQWDRTEDWVDRELVNCVEPLAEGDGWREERTGLHEREFIETRRHWFTGTVQHDTQGGVNVLNLVEGREAIVESPSRAFEPFVVHYAETFIVPASVGPYTVRPYGESEGLECATMKAFVRT